MNWAAITWLGLLVVFLIVEGVCPFHLVSIWFAAGALAAMITALLTDLIWVQVVVFLVVSCLLLALLYPLVRKFLAPKVTRTNVDAIIGSTGIVTAAIDNENAQGQVKLGGMEWTARSTSGDPIEAGTRVRVDKIEGVKVFVTPVKVKSTV